MSATRVDSQWTDHQLHDLRAELDQRIIDRIKIRFAPRMFHVFRDRNRAVQRIEIDWQTFIALVAPHLD